jgi:hypothetical protein
MPAQSHGAVLPSAFSVRGVADAALIAGRAAHLACSWTVAGHAMDRSPPTIRSDPRSFEEDRAAEQIAWLEAWRRPLWLLDSEWPKERRAIADGTGLIDDLAEIISQYYVGHGRPFDDAEQHNINPAATAATMLDCRCLSAKSQLEIPARAQR